MKNINKQCNNELSYKVLAEIMATGYTSVICPVCGTKPQLDVSITPISKRLERIVGGCNCGYIRQCIVT